MVRLIFVLALVFASSGVGAPTFYKDVLPVLQQHCQSCHRPGEAGPMPLMDYAGTKPWARAIAENVRYRQMPPWHADPAIGHFLNDRSLSAAEIQTITDWVDAGLPAGDVKDAPKPVHWIEGWTIGQPQSDFRNAEGL
jgi:mono/diheme cytochrome c family protein